MKSDKEKKVSEVYLGFVFLPSFLALAKRTITVLKLQIHLANFYMVASKTFHSLITEVFKEKYQGEKKQTLSVNHH